MASQGVEETELNMTDTQNKDVPGYSCINGKPKTRDANDLTSSDVLKEQEKSINGELKTRDANDMTDVPKEQIQSINGELKTRDANDMTDVSKEQIQSINGELKTHDANDMTDVPKEQIQSINGKLKTRDASGLTTSDVSETQEQSINGVLEKGDANDMTTVDVLEEQEKSINGELKARDSSDLITLDAPEKLDQSIGELKTHDASNLTTLDVPKEQVQSIIGEHKTRDASDLRTLDVSKEQVQTLTGELITCVANDLTTSDVPEEQNGWTANFVFVMMVAYLIIPCVSYSNACLNAPAQLVKDFMNATKADRNGQGGMSESRVDNLFGLMVAVIGIGAAVGSLTSSALADRLGRKISLVIASLTAIVGILTMSLCRTVGSYEMLFVGRSIVGVSIGWGLTIAPAYVAELCLPNMKGSIAMGNQLSQSASFVTAQVIGYQELLGNDYWVYLIGFPLPFLCAQILLLLFCPESPRYLLFKRNDIAGATKALQSLRNRKDVEKEIVYLHTELEGSRTDTQVSMLGLLTTPILRRPLLIAVVLGLYINWCGMASIQFFSTSLFEDAGVTGKASRYATSGAGFTFFVCNIIALFIIPKVGRKTLLSVGSFAIGVCCAALTPTMLYKDEVSALKYANIALFLLINAFCALGPVCAYRIIPNELFPHSARGSGISAAVLSSFLGIFTHAYVFPEMLASMGSYTFLVFAGINFLMVAFAFFYIPETKGKAFPDIAMSWAMAEDMKSTDDAQAKMDAIDVQNVGIDVQNVGIDVQNVEIDVQNVGIDVQNVEIGVHDVDIDVKDNGTDIQDVGIYR